MKALLGYGCYLLVSTIFPFFFFFISKSMFCCCLLSHVAASSGFLPLPAWTCLKVTSGFIWPHRCDPDGTAVSVLGHSPAQQRRPGCHASLFLSCRWLLLPVSVQTFLLSLTSEYFLFASLPWFSSTPSAWPNPAGYEPVDKKIIYLPLSLPVTQCFDFNQSNYSKVYFFIWKSYGSQAEEQRRRKGERESWCPQGVLALQAET